MFNVACKQNNIPDEFSEPGGDSDGGTTPVDPEPENNEDSNNGSEEEVAPDPNRPDIDLKPLDEDGNIIDEPEGSVENVTQETEKQKSKTDSSDPLMVYIILGGTFVLANAIGYAIYRVVKTYRDSRSNLLIK